MDHGSLEELLGEPGEYIGARRVRRPRPGAGVLALEWWDGTAWIRAGEAAGNEGVRAWLSAALHGPHPWQPGTGRRRRTPEPPPQGRSSYRSSSGLWELCGGVCESGQVFVDLAGDE
ncbi:hypothetical protein, partial [Streptodolium elevatio]